MREGRWETGGTKFKVPAGVKVVVASVEYLCGGKKFDFHRWFRVKVNLLHGVPVPDVLRPAVRVLQTSLFIETVAVCQDGFLSPEVAVVWGNETNTTVQVLNVIPINETTN